MKLSILIFRHNQLFKITPSGLQSYTVEEFKYGEWIWKDDVCKGTVEHYLNDCHAVYVSATDIGSLLP